MSEQSIYGRLQELGIELPQASAPAAEAASSDIQAPDWARSHIVGMISEGLYVPVDTGADYAAEPLLLGDASVIIIHLINRSVEQ